MIMAERDALANTYTTAYMDIPSDTVILDKYLGAVPIKFLKSLEMNAYGSISFNFNSHPT